MPAEMTPKEQIIREMIADPVLAHRLVFKKRHAQATPPFHEKLITAIHSSVPNILNMAFRGAAKSTLAEEAMTLLGAMSMFKNGLILGESETRAVERLRAIKHEIETNEILFQIFGVGPGQIWTEAKVTLSNGVMLQAYGRNQSIRGAKHLEYRPDFLLADDLEDEDSVRTPEARAKTMDWFAGTVMPAMEPGSRMRINATPLDPEALAPTLSRNPHWTTITVPIEYPDAQTGERVPAWPERYDIAFIDQKRSEYASIGRSDRFQQEYMCQATDPASRTFTHDMFLKIVNPLVQRSWHAVYAMFDPARTVKTTSATTGLVVWSWIGSRLIVWESAAERWMPDEIVNKIFDINDRYMPVAVGVEETGLNEFLLQPIRQQSLIRRTTIPLRALHAPKGKIDFIRGLQPFFRAGEVTFATEMPQLRDQLLGFPTGAIDAPNALAYALKMRPGAPFYDLSEAHLVDDPIVRRSPIYLCVNAKGYVVSAMLVQIHEGVMTVHADWLREGAPGEVLGDMVDEARLVAVGADGFKLTAPLHHWQDFALEGLRPAVMRLPATLNKGGRGTDGREEVRKKLRTTGRNGLPLFLVARSATWTARALAGGYARAIHKDGRLADEPEPTSYATLMEGLEAFAGLLHAPSDEDDNARNWSYTPDGRRFLSARV